MDDPLLAWRKEFPILGHTTYMISHSLGAMPNRAAERTREYTDTWATRGIRAWEEGWWEMPITVGNLVGSIIGVGLANQLLNAHTGTSGVDWDQAFKVLKVLLISPVLGFGAAALLMLLSSSHSRPRYTRLIGSSDALALAQYAEKPPHNTLRVQEPLRGKVRQSVTSQRLDGIDTGGRRRVPGTFGSTLAQSQ